MACEAAGIDCCLAPFHSTRKLYSTSRLEREALQRQWSSASTRIIITQLKNPTAALLEQLVHMTLGGKPHCQSRQNRRNKTGYGLQSGNR
ncbi:MAG: hypothetical protein ABIO49_08665 [Dokdonella sp.]